MYADREHGREQGSSGDRGPLRNRSSSFISPTYDGPSRYPNRQSQADVPPTDRRDDRQGHDRQNEQYRGDRRTPELNDGRPPLQEQHVAARWDRPDRPEVNMILSGLGYN